MAWSTGFFKTEIYYKLQIETNREIGEEKKGTRLQGKRRGRVAFCNAIEYEVQLVLSLYFAQLVSIN